MANEKQFKLKTIFVGTRGVAEYRESITQWVNPNDTVLEIGCEWGTTTVLLAPHCKEVIGTDVSPECIQRARLFYPHIRFDKLRMIVVYMVSLSNHDHPSRYSLRRWRANVMMRGIPCASA